MRLIADREILAAGELEIPAAPGEEDPAIERGRPGDAAFGEAFDFLEERISVVGAGHEHFVGGGAQDEGVGSADAGFLEGEHGGLDGGGEPIGGFGQGDGLMGRGGDQSLDAGGGQTLVDGVFLEAGDFARRADEGVEIGRLGPAVDIVQLPDFQREGNADFHEGEDLAQTPRGAAGAVAFGDFQQAQVDGAEFPAVRSAEIDEGSSGEIPREGAFGLGIDFRPRFIGDGRHGTSQ